MTPTKAKGGSVVVVVVGWVVTVVLGVALVFFGDRDRTVGGLEGAALALASRALVVAREPQALRPRAMAAGKSTPCAAERRRLRQFPPRDLAMGALLALMP